MAEGAPTTPHLGNIGIGVVYANSFLISSSVNGAGEDGGTETTGGAGGLNNSFIAFCRWNFMRLLIIKGSSGAEFMPSCSGWLACWLGKGKFCCALLQPISGEDEGTFGRGPPPPPSRAHMRLMKQMEYGLIVSNEDFERGPTPPPSWTHMRLKEQKDNEQVYFVH